MGGSISDIHFGKRTKNIKMTDKIIDSSTYLEDEKAKINCNSDKSFKDDYDALVTSSPQGSIYCRRWWLDAVAPGKYKILEVRRGGTLIAAWPVTRAESCESGAYVMPPLCQKLGILFNKSLYAKKYSEFLSDQHKICEELLGHIAPGLTFEHRFHESFTNWLPFYWSGFYQTTRYTYILENISDSSALWDGLRSECRREIRNAQTSLLKIEFNLPLDDFIALNEQVFTSQGSKPPISREIIISLDQACSSRSCRQILGAFDRNGKLAASAYLVWDNGQCYYLMGGYRRGSDSPGALRFLLWEAIRFSSTFCQRFDFEGSMLRGPEEICRDFGARQYTYFSIAKAGRSKARSRLHPARVSAGILRRLANFIDPA